MKKEEASLFIKQAFAKLIDKGWINEKLKPSSIMEMDIELFETKYKIQLPCLYKEFLLTYELPCSTVSKRSFIINGIIYNEYDEGPELLWLMLDRVKNINALMKGIDEFREIAVDDCKAPPGSYQHLVPIGNWGAGWGTLCIDLNLAKQAANLEDASTWSLVWFDHEEFDWEEEYLDEDGLLYGRPAAPDFKTLMEWYFLGTLESDFEKENQVVLDFEKMSNQDFCNSYWEERWKTKE